MKNMKKKNFLQFGLTVLSALCTAVCLTATPAEQPVAQAAGKAVVANIHIGDKIEAKDYTISSANGGVQAEGMKIVYPSGGIYGSDKFVIDQAGEYQVTYYATVNGERVEETKTYMAIRRPQDMIVAESGMKVEYGKFAVSGSPYELKHETYGALVHFRAGQSITFAANLKTADLTAGNNFLEMMAMPSVYGETDFERLTVRLTDVGDANNYVEYIIDSSNQLDGEGMVSYVRAGANGRQYGGWEYGKENTFHIRSYGTQVEHSFRGWGCLNGDRNKPTVSELAMTLALDNESKQLFIGPESSGEGAGNRMVNDLDDETNYKGDPWGGFTSDEVSVTISASAFSKSEGVLLIKSFAGYNLAKDVADTVAPEIQFDYDMSEELPTLKKGTRFDLIPYIAKDNLDKVVKSNVWVNHIDINGRSITVEHDGESFMVDYAGKYEVIYYAEDYSGNVTKKTIELTAVEEIPEIIVNVGEELVQEEVYNTVRVPYASEITAAGGSGALSVQRAVYSPSGELLDVDDALQLVELGDYRIVYTATDYYGNVGEGVITVRSSSISAPKFVEDPYFTDALLAGFTYEFPKALAVETVGSDVIIIPCKTYVNGELVEGSFVAAGEEMVIRYLAEGQTGSVEWTETISVINTQKGKYKSKYFYTEDEVQVIDEKNYLQFNIFENARLTFLNSLPSKDFSLALEYAKDNVHFTGMNFILTDAENHNLSVTLSFTYDSAADAWTLSVNNSKVAYAVSKGIFSFVYSHADQKIVDTNGEAVATITAYDNGKPFAGFSETIYFDIEFTGVSAQSSIYFSNIAGQALGHNKKGDDPLASAKDETKPIIVLDEAFLLRQKIGTKAKIPTAKAYDVLGQIVEFTVTVEKKGKVLYTGSATEKVDLLLDQAGNYDVTYFAKDSNNQKRELGYMITVADEIAPTLSVNGSLESSYGVGSKISIPSYSASDNNGDCTIQVMLIFPDNEQRLLHYSKNGSFTSLLDKENDIYDTSFKADSNTFIVQKKGKYILRFLAYDSDYNYTVREIVFWVQ